MGEQWRPAGFGNRRGEGLYYRLFGYFMALNRYLRMQYLDPEIAQLRDLDILDVGAGDGQFTVKLAGRGNRVTALDPAPSPELAARPEIAFLAGTGEALPFPDASFDVVFCSDVFEHLPSYQPALAEISRVLRPGGRAFVSTVEGAWRSPLPIMEAVRRLPASLARRMDWRQDTSAELQQLLGHINLDITAETLVKDAAACELEPVKTVRYCWGFGSLLMEAFSLGGFRWKKIVFPGFRLMLPLDKVLRFGKSWQFYVVLVKRRQGRTQYSDDA